MSRHAIPARDPARHQVFVGWDHPLLTFFVQVYDLAKAGDDNIVHWVGASPRELYEVDDLVRATSRFADVTTEMRGTLYGDKDDGR